MKHTRSLAYRPGLLARLIAVRARWRLSLNGALVLSNINKELNISLASIKDANVSEDFLWSWWTNFTIHNHRGEKISLFGLSRSAALELRNALAKRVSQHLLTKIDNLEELPSRLDEFYKQNRYLANRDVDRLFNNPPAPQFDHLRKALQHSLFDQSVLASDLYVQTEDLLGERAKLHERNEEFIKRELIHEADFFDRVEQKPLTKEQRRAAIVMEDHHLLIAPAGSGKTSAIVGKIGYALKKNLCRPSQIVALAFNGSAADELQQRVKERLGDLGGSDVEIKTFHALGLKFISEAKNEKPRVADWAVNLGENPGKKTEELVSGLCKTNPAFIARLANLLSYFLWAMKPLHFFHSEKEYELYLLAIRAQRSAQEKGVLTINGERVRSLEECAIANWLYVNGLQYEYERNYEHDEATQDYGQYRPDFYYPQTGLYHEHFALDENGKSPDFFSPDYVDSVEWKRQLHQQRGTLLIETTSAMFRNGTIFKHLREKLETYGAFDGAVPPPPAKVFERIAEHFTRPIYSLMHIFLSHWKSTGVTEEDLRARLVGFSGFDRLRAEAFLDVMIPLREAYERKLLDHEELDFDDMLTGASAALRDEGIRHPYKLILVDEFQDISPSRAQMLRAMLSQDPDCKLFAVGDDWQAIYRFAGADISIMTNFHDEFGSAAKDQLTRTFRSNQGIVNVASQFVRKNPNQISKKVHARDSTCEGVVHVVYYQSGEHVDPTIETKLREIVANGGLGKTSVYILARYNHLCSTQLPKWKKFFAKGLDIQFMNMHKSKGLEADYVIVLGMDSGRYSFPCEIEDDPILKLVMPTIDPFEFAEERRLFYVALTRAKRKVYLLTQQNSPSRFIKEIILDDQDGSVVLEKTHATGKTDPVQICLKCKTGFLIERIGPFGSFMGCSTYPLCRHTSPVKHVRKTST